MALPEIDAICRHCHHTFRATPTRDFMGFQRLTCPSCSHQLIYPLTSGYRTTYWVLVGLMVLAFFASLAQGNIAFPGIIGLAMIWALDKDRRVRKDVAAAERSGTATSTSSPQS